MPTSTLLYQNFPNPFPAAGRDSTCLWFDVATTGMVELDILDLRGNHVRRFVPGPDFPAILPAAGTARLCGGGGICDPRLMWDGRADDGHPLPAGVYLASSRLLGCWCSKNRLQGKMSMELVTVGTAQSHPQPSYVRLSLGCARRAAHAARLRRGSLHRLAEFGLRGIRCRTSSSRTSIRPLERAADARVRAQVHDGAAAPRAVRDPRPSRSRAAAAHAREGYGDWLLDPGFPIGILDVRTASVPVNADVSLETFPVPHTTESVALSVVAPKGVSSIPAIPAPAPSWPAGRRLRPAAGGVLPPEARAMDFHLTPERAGDLAKEAGAKA